MVALGGQEQGIINDDNIMALIVLANSRSEVFYAGDMWIEDGILNISNNSGTYAPSEKYLPNLKEYFLQNFGIDVVTHSFE